MADWYVYQYDAAPMGPLSTELVADAIAAGRLSPEIWVAAPGGPRWLRALDVPVIARLVRGLPEGPRRRDSGLRMMPKALAREPAPTPAIGVFIPRFDDAPPTDPMPTSSVPTRPGVVPVGGGDTLESAGNERKRRRR